jgi:hypothetical protein
MSGQCDHCMLKLNHFNDFWNENQMFGIQQQHLFKLTEQDNYYVCVKGT